MTEVEENKISQLRFEHWTSRSHNETNINSINFWANKTYNTSNINRIYHPGNGCRIKKENVWHVGWGVYYSLCWVLSACYLPVAVPRAAIFVFNQLLLDSISNVKYYNLFGALYRHPTIYSEASRWPRLKFNPMYILKHVTNEVWLKESVRCDNFPNENEFDESLACAAWVVRRV